MSSPYRRPRGLTLSGFSQVRDWHGALRIAVKLRHGAEDQEVIARGWEASCRPNNYIQMRQDPEALMEAAITVLRKHYGARGE